MSLLIFYLLVPFITERGALLSPNRIMYLCISPFSSISFWFLHFVVFLFIIGDFLCSEVYFVWYYYRYSCFVLISVHMAYLLPFKNFNIPILICSNWVFCRQHVAWSHSLYPFYQFVCFNWYIRLFPFSVIIIVFGYRLTILFIYLFRFLLLFFPFISLFSPSWLCLDISIFY